jgi:hypothetical protein
MLTPDGVRHHKGLLAASVWRATVGGAFECRLYGEMASRVFRPLVGFVPADSDAVAKQ